jgi:hypothetical protein
MAIGPAPQAHQVVYTTLHHEKPWALDSYLKQDGYTAWKKILAEKCRRSRSSRWSSSPAFVAAAVRASRPA